MANLVIVESPTKAHTIKGFLGSNYKVVASNGHIRDLPKSSLGVDIESNFEPKYINIRGKGKLIASLKNDAKNANKIFLATDADREGEAISWHLATLLGIEPENAMRVTFNEITKSAIKDAIKTPRCIDMDLVNAQQTRRILDRIVGYKLSPYLWKTVKSGLSAGRVQSVATRIIVEREEEINSFVSEEYWTLSYLLKTEKGCEFTARFVGDKNGKIELKSEEETNSIINELEKGVFSVSDVKRSVKKRSPLPPYTTSTLQQDAYKKLGFQSARTMSVAQELYEGINIGQENGGVHGLITYMRTDSLRISDYAANACENYIKTKFGSDFYPEKRRVFKTKKGAQDAHEAIRPSSMEYEPSQIKSHLSRDQYNLYKLIWDRFVASQMENARFNTVSCDINNGKYLLRASGNTLIFKGYLAIYNDRDEEDDNILPDMKTGDNLAVASANPEQHFTEPPARFSDGTLVKFLEEKGIGRPSTFSTIITTIISRGYIAREGKTLRPTPLGVVTTQLMKEKFPDIVDYKFTADMEDSLDNIENGEEEPIKVLDDFYRDFKTSLEKAEAETGGQKYSVPDEETDIICDKCGSKMIIKNGRFGKFAACPNYPECKNTKPIDKNGNLLVKEETKPEKTDEKCEKCGADMVIRNGRYGSFLACSNYPTCKNTKPILNETGVNCPDCGGKILVRQGKRHMVFYSCENFPKCKFSSWDLPLNKKCPNCSSMLFKKKSKNLIVCHNPECGYKCEDDSSN